MGIYVDEQGYSKKWYRKDGVHLYAEYKATIKPVYEESGTRYILLEYLKESDFMILRDGRLLQGLVPNPLPKDDHQDIYKPKPTLPKDGRKGTVQVLLYFGGTGAVTEVTILQSSGYADIDEAVVQTLKQWRLEPATKDGVPVSYTRNIIFRVGYQ